MHACKSTYATRDTDNTDWIVAVSSPRFEKFLARLTDSTVAIYKHPRASRQQSGVCLIRCTCWIQTIRDRFSTMPCMCVGHSVTALHAGSAGAHLAENRKGTRVASTSLRAHHQLPGPACMKTFAQCTTPADRRSRCAGCRPARRSVCKAQEQEEKEKDMVGGFDVDAPAGFLESEAVGIVFKVGSRSPLTTMSFVHLLCNGPEENLLRKH